LASPPPSTTHAFTQVLLFYVVEDANLWQYFNWTITTTVAVFAGPVDPQLMCTAHSHGARVTIGTYFDVNQLGNMTAEWQWINSTIAGLQTAYLDGINLDIEGYSGMAEPLVAFTERVGVALRAAIPTAQLSFDTTIFPESMDGYYGFSGLAAACDFLVPMA